MPNGPDTGGNPDPHADAAERERLVRLKFRLAGDRLVDEQQRRLVVEQEATRDKARKALNVTLDVVSDPAAAPRLAARHNAHVRTGIIASAMFDAYNGTGDVRVKAMNRLDAQRQSATDNGVFVFEYPASLEERRLTDTYADGSKQYLVVESSGSHPTPGNARYGAPRPSADAQFRIPEAVDGAAPVFSIPDGTREPVADDLTNKIILGQVLLRPESVAQLEDIATDEGMGKLGLASAAIDEGLRQIVEVLNPRRGNHAIEYVVAEIVSIRGLLLKTGHEIFFDHEIPGTAMLNGRSMMVFDHFRSKYVTSFAPAWTLERREVPVHGHSHVQSILASWYVKVARLRQ